MKPLHILAPTDFSDTSLKAFETANFLANFSKGSVTPFHSYIPLSEIDGYFYMGLGVTSQLSNTDLDKMLTEKLNEVADQHIPAALRKPVRLGLGNAANAIENIAEAYDLIVMGSHGRSGLSRFIMGSVAEKVLRMVSVPVLIVKEDHQLTKLKSVLIPLDLSLNSISVIAFIRNLMGEGSINVHLLHVITTDEYNDDKNARIQAHLQESNLQSIIDTHLSEYSSRITYSTLVNRNPAYEEIVNYAHSGDFDMIAMTRVGKSALSYITLGSTTANVIRATDLPVLSVRPPSAE